MKKYQTMILLSIFCLFPGINGFSQGKSSQQNWPEDRCLNTFRTEKTMGAKVVNMKGEKIGYIKDFVVDIETGAIQYAVLDFDGFRDIGNVFFPVPWKSLAINPSDGVFVLMKSKEQIEKSQEPYQNNPYDTENAPRGTTRINKVYQAPPDERNEESNNGYRYGLRPYRERAQQDPFVNIFDTRSVKKFQGQVIKVEKVIPRSGNTSQAHIELIVYVGREAVPVYIGPEWYIDGQVSRSQFKSGDEVIVTGSWVTSEGPLVIASSVTKGDKTLQLRDREGTPIW